MKNEPANSRKEKARLLIVDDEVPQMKALCDTLEDEGFVAKGFSDADEALEALRNENFDLLLADLMMPKMDGITLLREATQIRPDLAGIIMTGQGTIGSAVEAMQTGAMDYVLKPFKLSAVLPVIMRALDVRQLRIQKAELEERLRERTSELEAANEELKAYSYSIAHDLRAPLRSVSGFARILQKQNAGDLPPDAQQNIARICESADRMGALIDGLLDFSSLTWIPVTKGAVNPNAMVKQVIEELKGDLDGRPVQWRIQDLPPCKGDPMLLRQVFANLISNAVKYSKHRNPALIEIGAKKENSTTVYYVRDNGAGFDMDYGHKLFRVFQRLHTQQQFEGTGVGLAITNRILQRHGGRIWAEGAVEKGATFYFTVGEGKEE